MVCVYYKISGHYLRADDIRPYKQEHMLCAKSELPYSTHTGKD